MLQRPVSSFLILLLTLLVSGCAIPILPDTQQKQQFGLALDQYLTQSDLTALETLAAQQPVTAWSQRANALVHQLQQQQENLSKEQQRLQQQQQRFEQTLQQHRLCQQENAALKETMKQLKLLLIEMELRE